MDPRRLLRNKVGEKEKKSAPGEDRTHDLQIMRLTLYRLSHRGASFLLLLRNTFISRILPFLFFSFLSFRGRMSNAKRKRDPNDNEEEEEEEEEEVEIDVNVDRWSRLSDLLFLDLDNYSHFFEHLREDLPPSTAVLVFQRMNNHWKQPIKSLVSSLDFRSLVCRLEIHFG